MIRLLIVALLSTSFLAAHGQSQQSDLVTYQKDSVFIQEFPIPLTERGLRGITTDSEGNVWTIHSTNSSSLVLKFEPRTGRFMQYPIAGETISENAVINLAAAQLVFDESRNKIWFTDARINSIGGLDIPSGEIQTWKVQSNESGPMGIALSPDGSTIWFSEITANNIASFDIQSEKITEYSTGDESGPVLLTFDDTGNLWTSLSFSKSVLRVDTRALPSRDAMIEFKLPGEDTFSPFGVAVSNGKIYVSDHGSSRVIAADLGFANYVSYWTSPSMEFPTTLPGEVVADSQGNVYFPQHGGNRISVINRDGVMTEYDIPTGPLSTVLFVAASAEGVWFTEWAANKLAYLNTSARVPFDIKTSVNDIILSNDEQKVIDVYLNAPGSNPSVSLSEIGLAVIGMTESGLRGVTYASEPQRVDMEELPEAHATISLQSGQGGEPRKYHVMIRATALESDGLLVSKLYPVSLTLDIPSSSGQLPQTTAASEANPLGDTLRIAAISAVVVIVAYLVYRRMKKRQSKAN